MREEKLLAEFRKNAEISAPFIELRFGRDKVEKILDDSLEIFRELIPRIPSCKGAGPLNLFIRITAQELAIYKAMKPMGYGPSEAWEVCHATLVQRTKNFPRWAKTLLRLYMFSPIAKFRISRKIGDGKDLGGSRVSYVKHGSSWGVDYTKCAMNEFVRSEGAPEFAPYPCLSDIALSDAMGWGLERTETLAEGCNRCDFRFVKNQPTRISSKNPEIQKAINTSIKYSRENS